MPTQGGFSSGSDETLVIMTASGPLTIQSSAIMEFDTKPKYVEGSETNINGVTNPWNIVTGGSGSMMLNRLDPSVEQLLKDATAAQKAGLSSYYATIKQIILEVDGSITTNTYKRVAIKVDDLGKWAGTTIVKQSISFQYGEIA
jgi:hypothetical protein